MSRFRRLGIVGVGLIGGSLGLVARREKLAEEIVGVGRSQENLDTALARGILDRASTDASVLDGADLVVLATPIGSLARMAGEIAPRLAPGAIVTDVGSVKSGVVESCTAALGARARFVGGHPIAGTETSGAQAARIDLFAGARCVLTPNATTDREALAGVRGLWESAGMDVVEMSAEEHDRILALTSHLPHVAAFALALATRDAREAGGADPLAFAGPSFRDMTRVASSSPEMWRDILLANAASVGHGLERFGARLEELGRAVREGDPDALRSLLEDSRALRRTL
ncbi:MAG: prephenate dehydrogenase, partial [Deltaproteobacteria bacterium]|nr:prephenate dehydrogenase [Deltaproteobacteria bacterium]